LPHLSIGRRGPAPKLSLHKIFNYILAPFQQSCHQPPFEGRERA
jgi:hypothetical protein